MKSIIRILVLVSLMTVGFSSCDETSIDMRAIYVATYNVTETWTENGKTMTKAPYSMTITLSVLINDMVLLNNFANYGAGVTVEATMLENTLTIKQQTLPNSIVVSGTATLTDPTLTIKYTETLNNNSINVTAVAKKR